MAGRPPVKKQVEEVKFGTKKDENTQGVEIKKTEPINLNNVEELLLQIKNGLVDIENELIKLNENLSKDETCSVEPGTILVGHNSAGPVTIDTRKLLLETKETDSRQGQGQAEEQVTLENMKLNELSALIEMLGEVIRLNNYSGGNVTTITKANTVLAKVRKEIDNRIDSFV